MVSDRDATPAHYELAYDEARRALDAQESVVNELRTRAGVLIAAAAITTVLLRGACALRRRRGDREEGPLPLAAIHRDLALHMSASYVANARQLRALTIAFRIGAMFLVGEVVAWVIGIADAG
jgi:hypothetical protein